MNNSELIADKIEEVIRRMSVDSISLYPRASEYSIFYDPKKHASWFSLIFFTDRNQLNEGIKNGACYKIYRYLLNELKKVDEISNIDRSIFFESGNRPVKKVDLDNLFGKLLDKMDRVKFSLGLLKKLK